MFNLQLNNGEAWITVDGQLDDWASVRDAALRHPSMTVRVVRTTPGGSVVFPGSAYEGLGSLIPDAEPEA
jgi:hypothetical protein